MRTKTWLVYEKSFACDGDVTFTLVVRPSVNPELHGVGLDDYHGFFLYEDDKPIIEDITIEELIDLHKAMERLISQLGGIASGRE